MQFLERSIGGPRECLGVDSREAWERKAKTIRVRMGLPPRLTEAAEKRAAFVSAGRWVFDCPCGSAGLASHEWGVGICPDCGTVYGVTFPRNREAVEAALLERPVGNRHYFPDAEVAERRGLGRAERLSDLRQENDLRGLGSTKERG